LNFIGLISSGTLCIAPYRYTGDVKVAKMGIRVFPSDQNVHDNSVLIWTDLHFVNGLSLVGGMRRWYSSYTFAQAIVSENGTEGSKCAFLGTCTTTTCNLVALLPTTSASQTESFAATDRSAHQTQWEGNPEPVTN